MTVNLIPMGTLALADLASQKGYQDKILHLGLEWIENGVFSPSSFMKEKRSRSWPFPSTFINSPMM